MDCPHCKQPFGKVDEEGVVTLPTGTCLHCGKDLPAVMTTEMRFDLITGRVDIGESVFTIDDPKVDQGGDEG